ncbi:MAG: four helix bundle protein [Bacteroidota bacterium]
MSTFKRFEEIEAWQLGRELTQHVYAASRSGDFARDFALRDQIRRAAISVTSNIAEGFERRSRREFCRFLDIAKASNAEVRSQLYVALDEGYLSTADFDALYELSSHVGAKLGSLLRYLRSTRQPT